MNPATILKDAAADGVKLSLSAAEAIKAAGEQAAIARWLTTIKENKAGIVALLAEVANEKPFEASRWMIHFSDRNPLEVAFSPAVSHAEVLASYPDALAAERLDAITGQTPTPIPADQEAAIVGWLAAIGETDQVIIADLLTTTCGHDEGARAYYLGRAGYAVADDLDDRRSCRKCRNLRAGACIVAKPGGIVSATRGYRPAEPEMLRRCEGYAT